MMMLMMMIMLTMMMLIMIMIVPSMDVLALRVAIIPALVILTVCCSIA